MNLAEAFEQVYYSLTLNELRMMNQEDDGHDISYNTMMYLHLIAYKKDCTVSYLATALHVSKPAVTAKVNELHRLGLVKKEQSEQDKRVFYLRASAFFLQKCKEYDRVLFRTLQTVQAQYSQQENEIFCRMLEAFSKEYLKNETEKQSGEKI